MSVSVEGSFIPVVPSPADQREIFKNGGAADDPDFDMGPGHLTRVVIDAHADVLGHVHPAPVRGHQQEPDRGGDGIGRTPAAEEQPEIGRTPGELAGGTQHRAIAAEEQRVAEVDAEDVGDFGAPGQKNRAGTADHRGLRILAEFDGESILNARRDVGWANIRCI